MQKINETESVGALNAAGSGSVDGIGVGEKGEPGSPKKKLRTLFPLETKPKPESES